MKKVFITGGTGTLGKALIKRFYHQWDITVYSRDEYKQAQLKTLFPDIEYRIGDVRDYQALFKAMKGMNAVIHTAAMKRIEVCEEDPIEAVKTNVLGTENVVTLASHHGISAAVTIGSDKGVEPVNTYGMTKALQERIFVRHGYNCVRYGNVFGSRGSVIPLFSEQSKKGLPLTVTNPEMTRFILTIDEAVDLVRAALESPMRGEILVKKSPAARLIDTARAFSNDIKVVGGFYGEKLHETLISAEETTRIVTREDGYVVISREIQRKEFGEPYTSDKERMLSVDEIRKLIAVYEASHLHQ